MTTVFRRGRDFIFRALAIGEIYRGRACYNETYPAGSSAAHKKKAAAMRQPSFVISCDFATDYIVGGTTGSSVAPAMVLPSVTMVVAFSSPVTLMLRFTFAS